MGGLKWGTFSPHLSLSASSVAGSSVSIRLYPQKLLLLDQEIRQNSQR